MSSGMPSNAFASDSWYLSFPIMAVSRLKVPISKVIDPGMYTVIDAPRGSGSLTNIRFAGCRSITSSCSRHQLSEEDLKLVRAHRLDLCGRQSF